MLLAEAAILVHLKAIGIVLLVLDGIVIALLALGAGQRNLNALIGCHLRHLLLKSMRNKPLEHALLLYHIPASLSIHLENFLHK